MHLNIRVLVAGLCLCLAVGATMATTHKTDTEETESDLMLPSTVTVHPTSEIHQLKVQEAKRVPAVNRKEQPEVAAAGPTVDTHQDHRMTVNGADSETKNGIACTSRRCHRRLESFGLLSSKLAGKAKALARKAVNRLDSKETDGGNNKDEKGDDSDDSDGKGSGDDSDDSDDDDDNDDDDDRNNGNGANGNSGNEADGAGGSGNTAASDLQQLMNGAPGEEGGDINKLLAATKKPCPCLTRGVGGDGGDESESSGRRGSGSGLRQSGKRKLAGDSPGPGPPGQGSDSKDSDAGNELGAEGKGDDDSDDSDDDPNDKGDDSDDSGDDAQTKDPKEAAKMALDSKPGLLDEPTTKLYDETSSIIKEEMDRPQKKRADEGMMEWGKEKGVIP